MALDYSSVTLHVPYSYYSLHLAEMLLLTDRFRNLKVEIGGVDRVTVTSAVESRESVEVSEWCKANLPAN